MKLHVLAAIPLALIVTSCASAPEAIKAQQISAQPYTGFSCQALGTQYAQASNAYEAAAADQRKAQQGDALGVFLIGIPVSSMAGNDREADVSYQKGMMQAISEAQRQKGCARA